MKRLVSLILFLILCLGTKAGNNIDSLVNAFRYGKNDSLKINAAIKIFNSISDKYPDSSYTYIQQSLAISEKNGMHLQTINLLISRGKIFDRLDEYLKAQKSFMQAENLLDSIKSAYPDSVTFPLQLIIENNYAIIYFQTDKLEDAKLKYEEIIKEVEKRPDPLLRETIKEIYMMSNNNLGAVYLQEEDYDKSELYFLKALSLLKPSDKSSLSTILNNLGIIEKDRGNYTKSYDYLSRAIKLRRESDNPEGLAQSLNNLGSLLYKNGKTRPALDTLQSALKIARENRLLRSGSIALESLSDIYTGLHEYEKALEYYKEYKQQYDSLMNQEKLQNITKLEMQQRFEQKMHDEEMQRKEEVLRQQKKESIYLVIIIVVLFILIIILMLYALQRSKMKRQTLMAEKDRLKSKSLELENEKLNMDLEYKNKELTTNVMHLARTNEFISNIASKLKQSRNSFTKENQKLIYELIRDLQSFSDRDTWKEFELRFQQVHKDFYDRLLVQFPDLSSNEKKLCAFLRLNMTTKEISAITYQSVNSIIVARYRLRKKLGVDKDENLVSFLERL